MRTRSLHVLWVLLAGACATGVSRDTGAGVDALGFDVRTLDAPALDAPGDDALALDAPGLDAPGLDAPSIDAPADAAMGCGSHVPPGWPTFTLYPHNPLLIASAATNMGMDNVYAPDVQLDGYYRMWFGAQGADGHDQIFFAWSTDGMSWHHYPSSTAPTPALDRGTANHVNDPSVLNVSGGVRMYYTEAMTAEDDRIAYAESSDGTSFTRRGLALDVGASGAWDSEKVGRPSVHFDGTTYFMWYDGTFSGARHVGLATSTDGIRFTRHPSNPVFRNAGAVDVQRVGDQWVMLREARDGTYWATSPDGLCWDDRGLLFGTSGGALDAFGHVTPFLLMGGGVPQAIYFGAASVTTWNRNRIAVALPPTTTLTGGGCALCTNRGESCDEACARDGLGHTGTCGTPGSTSVGSCCTCRPDGCEACTVGGVSCARACANAGAETGYCGEPGSTVAGRCCVCL